MPDENHCRVSVVIPCYNQAHYLAQAIQSVLDQTFQDFEIIVIDDGSQDDTAQVAARFGERVRCIRQENRGLAGARNTGIRNARGEFIALLDADDMWFPNYLSALLPPLQADLTIGATYCGWQYLDPNGQLLPRINIKPVPPEKMYAAMVLADFLIPSAVLVRRECFDTLGLFDENFRAAQGSEDWDMWLRVLSKYSMVDVAQALVKYRIHPSNMSSKLEQMERGKRAVIVKHFGTDERKSTLHRMAYGGLYWSSAVAYLERDDQAQGRAALAHAFQVYPELSDNLDTFYQLALTVQPIVVRGIFEKLDLESGAQRLFEHLDVIFHSPTTPQELSRWQARAYGMAYFALGLLAYGKGNLDRARDFLMRAVRSRPSLLWNKKWAVTFLKSMLGNRLLHSFKKWKQHGALANS